MTTPNSISRPRLALMAVPLAAAFVLTACGDGGGADADQEAGEPQAGGVLSVGMQSDYSCLDGQQARGPEQNIAKQILDGLTEQDIETGEIHPHLAEDWEINEDGSEFTFHLRDDVTFHNGEEFDAESVKRNFEEVADLGARSSLGQTYLAGLEEIEVLDDHTVRVAFEGPNAQFLSATATITLGFYADETLDELSAEERCQGDVIGTGPFEFESYTGQQTVSLVRNEGYAWASEVSENDGPAHLEGIEFTVIPEASVRNGSLLSGQLDVDPWVQVQDRDSLDAQDFPVHTQAIPGAPTNLWPNVNEAPLDEPEVREAVNYALDREELASVMFEEQEGATNTVAQSTPGYEPQADLLEHDPERAEQILEDAGWELGEDGVREKDGERLEVEITDYYQYNYIELLQEQLGEVGFDAAIRTVTFSERSSILESGDFEFMTGQLPRSDVDIVRTIHAFGQQNTNQREEENDLDQQLEDTLAITDDAERAEAVTGEISRELLEQGYAIPMVETLAVVGTGQHVHDFKFEASAARYDLYDTWISEE